MVIEYYLPRISIISSYINTHKTLTIFLFCKRRSSYFPPQKKSPVVGEINEKTCKSYEILVYNWLKLL